ncbi:unnamed protein product [Trichobilharzia regenti]|nr:unnamed protein product [Trichobilharzia regenti]
MRDREISLLFDILNTTFVQSANPSQLINKDQGVLVIVTMEFTSLKASRLNDTEITMIFIEGSRKLNITSGLVLDNIQFSRYAFITTATTATIETISISPTASSTEVVFTETEIEDYLIGDIHALLYTAESLMPVEWSDNLTDTLSFLYTNLSGQVVSLVSFNYSINRNNLIHFNMSLVLSYLKRILNIPFYEPYIFWESYCDQLLFHVD